MYIVNRQLETICFNNKLTKGRELGRSFVKAMSSNEGSLWGEESESRREKKRSNENRAEEDTFRVPRARLRADRSQNALVRDALCVVIIIISIVRSIGLRYRYNYPGGKMTNAAM